MKKTLKILGILFLIFGTLEAIFRLLVYVILPTRMEVSLPGEKASAIIEAIQTGKFVPDSRSEVKLPPSLDYGFYARRVFYTPLPDNGFAVYFPTLEDRFNWRGYVYVSRRLKAGDYDSQHRNGQFIPLKIWGPFPQPVHLKKQLNKNWYYVSERT